MSPLVITGIGLHPSDLGFEFDDWRSYQLSSAQRIINTEKRVVILQAPTGIGKSIIVQIPQRILGYRQLILTRTKQLQNQYGADGLPVLFGRDNYICDRFPVVTAAHGVCHLGQSCSLKGNGCSYYDAKRQALSASVSVLNYSYFLTEANGPGQFSGYDWVVCDEGHNVPGEISASYSIRINYADCRKFGLRAPSTRGDLEFWRRWADSVWSKLLAKSKEVPPDQAQMLEPIVKAVRSINRIQDPDNWVTEQDKFNIRFRPIWVDELAASALWSHAKRWLFSSATINPWYTMEQLGMRPSEVEFISVPSIFPVANRPLLTLPKHNVSHKAGDSDYLDLVADIDRILAKHNGRGLIHTGNYRLAKIIYSLSSFQKRFVTHDPDDREAKLTFFKSKYGEHRVLISPSMTEGVDLPYDMCEFQIIAKLPFPNRIDRVWEARLAEGIKGENAYVNETINSMAQAYGRSTRAIDDYSVTYILDRAFNYMAKRYNSRFPKFFSEAISYIQDIA